MIKQIVLKVNATKKESKLETVQDPNIIGPMGYGLHHAVNTDEDAIIFGRGVLAGSSIPGTHRLIVVGFSKLWEHFYASTMGGAAMLFLRLNINYLHLNGKCEKPSILKLNRINGKIKVEFEPVDVDTIWKGYSKEKGFYALQQYVFEKYHEEFTACRILATGPAAKYSRDGAIGSAPVEKGVLTYTDCWAGRGGLGSQLFQNHNIAGIIMGGDEVVKNENVTQRKKVDELFLKAFNLKMMPEDLIATKKYRYDNDFNSGGTFGVNFTKVKGEIFCFNYRSIYWTEEKRLDIHKKFILDHYLAQFNKETIEPKKFKNCGEPCPAVCKKMRGKYKKDYEPYQTLGPNSGIFDQRAAELVNHYADTMSIDAIQSGIIVSWIMDCLDQRLIPKEDLGLTRMPKWDVENFDLVNDSMHNAKLALEIIDMTFFSEHNKIFKNGMRVAAKTLAKKYGKEVLKCAVYNAQGEEGCIAPNQYWTPGMYSPMPLMGKYCTSYGIGYVEPEEIGRMNVERMIFELFSDNGGLCRFHRKWIEKVFPELVNTLYNEHIDYFKHHRKLAQDINWGNKPIFWESERIIDIIIGFIERHSEGEDKAKNWLKRFKKDKMKTAKEYWEALLRGQNEAFK